jgi:hypothetical protein
MEEHAVTAAPAILDEGIYDALPAEIYHDPRCTPEPSLSSSGAKILLDESPAHFKYRVLGGNQPRSSAFDIGNATHLLVLEPEAFAARTHLVDADDYRTKEARDAREIARGNGRIPLLRPEAQAVRAMRAALAAHPVAKHAFAAGRAERSYFWRDPETGVWLKARLDYEPEHRRYLADLKTAMSAHPETFRKRVAEYGYHISAAWYLDALERFHGETPNRFFFVVVEKQPPHVISVVELEPEALDWGRLQARKAIRLFADCLARGDWPGYADRAVSVNLPDWTLRDLHRQHEAGAFAEPDGPNFRERQHAAAFAAQRPL